jgi:hypothetical protein
MKKNVLYFIITALLLLNLVTFSKLNSLENTINNRFQQSDFVANSLRNEVNSIYADVETKLKKQGSILDKYNITFGELNPSNFTIPVTLSITPKEYSKGLTSSLHLNDNSVLMKNDGTSFVATVDAYVFDDFQLKVDLDKNGVKKIETIEEYYDLRNKYLLDITGRFSGESSYSSNEYHYSGKIDLQIGSSQPISAEKVSIVNYVNGVIVSEQKIDPSNSISIDVKDNIKLAAGDKFTMYAMVQDIYGLNYKYVIDVYDMGSNKDPINNFKREVEMQRLTEITDKNGKIVYSPKNDIVK